MRSACAVFQKAINLIKNKCFQFEMHAALQPIHINLYCLSNITIIIIRVKTVSDDFYAKCNACLFCLKIMF